MLKSTFKNLPSFLAILLLGLLLNVVTKKLLHMLILPGILVGLSIFGVFYYFPRPLMLLWRPFIIVNDIEIRYFSLVGYTKQQWSNIHRVVYHVDKQMIHFQRSKPKPIYTLELNDLSDEDKRVVVYLIEKKKQPAFVRVFGNIPEKRVELPFFDF